jgi:uncharacterized membrane protein
MEPIATTPHDTQPADAPGWWERAVGRLEDDPSIDALVASLRSFADPVGAGAPGEVLRGRWLGHALHPLLTDLPIGCWTSAALLDVLGGSASRDASRRLVGLGLLFVPVTAAAGLADWSVARDDATRRVGAVHAALNVAASACYVQSWRNRRKERHVRGIGWGMVGGMVASAAGYLGGHLAFGSQAVGDRVEAVESGIVDITDPGPTSDEHLAGTMPADPLADVSPAPSS